MSRGPAPPPPSNRHRQALLTWLAIYPAITLALWALPSRGAPPGGARRAPTGPDRVALGAHAGLKEAEAGTEQGRPAPHVALATRGMGSADGTGVSSSGSATRQ